jgi:osmotically-inducible protein OsmY
VRDRDSHALTPGDQSENEGDRMITKKIREIIILDDSLSTNAKNIKIITINGVVTLRGPVANSQEKNIIEKKARDVQGVKKVDNQIDVTHNNHVQQ